MISNPAQKLLDKIPGAVNPLSLRRISKSYSGTSTLIALRNGVTNAEGNIRLLNDDLSSTDLTTLLGGNDGYMRTLNTQSGGTNIGQSTTGIQPKLATDINGRYCLKFDGIDDTINMNTSLVEPSLFFTLCMVFNIPASVTGTLLQISTQDAGVDKRLVLSLVSGVLQLRIYDAANGGYYTNLQMTAPISGNIVLALVNNNKAITLQINGVTVATTAGTSPASAVPVAMFIGADRGFQNYLAFSLGEIIPYPRALAANELDCFTADAKEYWGIA